MWKKAVVGLIMEKKYIESDMAVQVLQDAIKRCPDSYYNGLVVAKNLIFNLPAVDAVSRDEGIKMGAELAAMHGSDATSQQLEEAYLKGVEDGMTRRGVRPVVLGKWVDYQQGRWIYAKCSRCETIHDAKSKFCPNCGAEMEES